MRGVFEASEVHVPTLFVVLAEKLPELPDPDQLAGDSKGPIKPAVADDGSGVSAKIEWNDKCELCVTCTEDGASVTVDGQYMETLNTGMKWVKRLGDIGKSALNGKPEEVIEKIKAGLDDLVTGKTMYLYLVDELTGEPVRGENYPIEIKTPSEIVPKLLPVMQVGLHAMSVYNGAAGIARMFGVPAPKVPKMWSNCARESVEVLKQKSSVEHYDVVQSVLDTDTTDTEG